MTAHNLENWKSPAVIDRRYSFASLRQEEFARLDATGNVYLDYTGAALYPASLVERDACRLKNSILGNPHSESTPSLASTESIEAARELTLRFLNADRTEYDVVFTSNATRAISILAEAFPFRSGSRLVMTADNHNSVNGLRIAARRRRAAVEYVGLDDELRSLEPHQTLCRAGAPSLFAFPAQSNFSGVHHPLEWVRDAQRQGYRVLLDAAAYLPTNSLSLSAIPADFVALSFYKMFGFPTGIGALVARREALAELRRAYFGGGTMQFVSVQNRMALAKAGGEAFEDGTPNFLATPAVCDGLRWLDGLGMRRVHRRITELTAALMDRLSSLGDRVRIYGPTGGSNRGGTVTFNLYRDGRALPYEAVEAAARDRGIAIRGGCFCNPGAAEHAFAIPARTARACLREGFAVSKLRACLGGAPVGALRASVGIPTTVADLDRLLEFAVSVTNGKMGT